jgi:hypothetical protein
MHFAFSDFAKRDHSCLVLGIYEGRITLHQLAAALGGEYDEGESVVFFFEAVFDGYAGHNLYVFSLPLSGSCRPGQKLPRGVGESEANRRNRLVQLRHARMGLFFCGASAFDDCTDDP